jgi:rubrerythrin
MKTTDIEETVKYLSSCSILENEAYLLYNIIVRKLEHPAISSITLALAHDCLKHSKVIQELYKPLTTVNTDLNRCKEDFRKIQKEIQKFSSEISTLNTISNDILPDLLKELANLEDCLYEIYSFFINSSMLKQLADGLSIFSIVTPENLAFIVETFREDNKRHREMLIESIYFYNKNQVINEENPAPFVKYQNPDRWVIG